MKFMSVMIQDLLSTYKLGWKTSYLIQTLMITKLIPSEMIDEPAHNIGWHDNPREVKYLTLANEEEEMCDACAI